MKRAGFFFLGVLAFGIGQTAQQAAPAVASVPANVQIRDAWIRWLPGDIPAGGYLTLVNGGSTTVRLLSASSADYGQVSLHQSRTEGGMSLMTPVAAITVQPRTALDFAAQGYHLMLLQPKRALKVGDQVAIVLHFEGGGEVVAQFELRPPDTPLSK
jgi:copper(I)-binding protein